MVSRNISIPFNFYCYTENSSGLNKNIPEFPKEVGLKLPKLKKLGGTQESPKLKLPKLKKVGEKQELPKLKLPKLNKV